MCCIMLCYQVYKMFPAQRTLLLFPIGHQVRTTFSSQTTLLFFPQRMIKCVPHFHRRQPCSFPLSVWSSVSHTSIADNLAFFPSAYDQVWPTLPSQTTLLFFPTTSSSVCDTSNTNDLAFFSQQIIKCVRCFQHKWPCFLFPTDYQVCAILPTQTTNSSFPGCTQEDSHAQVQKR